MATDIAFALGVLLLAARHAPSGLKPFMLTLAIVDDIGAIVVIALFYAGGVSPGFLLAAAGACALMLVLRRLGIRSSYAFIGLGTLVWLATYESGVHPTIAGVALGLLAPAESFQRPRAVSAEARRTADLTVDDPRSTRRRRQPLAPAGRAVARGCVAARPHRACAPAVDELRDRPAVRARERGRPARGGPRRCCVVELRDARRVRRARRRQDRRDLGSLGARGDQHDPLAFRPEFDSLISPVRRPSRGSGSP